MHHFVDAYEEELRRRAAAAPAAGPMSGPVGPNSVSAPACGGKPRRPRVRRLSARFAATAVGAWDRAGNAGYRRSSARQGSPGSAPSPETLRRRLRNPETSPEAVREGAEPGDGRGPSGAGSTLGTVTTPASSPRCAAREPGRFLPGVVRPAPEGPRGPPRPSPDRNRGGRLPVGSSGVQWGSSPPGGTGGDWEGLGNARIFARRRLRAGRGAPGSIGGSSCRWIVRPDSPQAMTKGRRRYEVVKRSCERPRSGLSRRPGASRSAWMRLDASAFLRAVKQRPGGSRGLRRFTVPPSIGSSA
jgi:hypothetical protein